MAHFLTARHVKHYRRLHRKARDKREADKIKRKSFRLLIPALFPCKASKIGSSTRLAERCEEAYRVYVAHSAAKV